MGELFQEFLLIDRHNKFLFILFSLPRVHLLKQEESGTVDNPLNMQGRKSGALVTVGTLTCRLIFLYSLGTSWIDSSMSVLVADP